jgi:hypothetical protein
MDPIRDIIGHELRSAMSDEFENVEYEDDPPAQQATVEILPPPKRRRDWKDMAIVAMLCLVGWHVVNRLADRFYAPAAGAVAAGMVAIPQERHPAWERRPVTRMVDETQKQEDGRCWETRTHPFCSPERDGCLYEYNVCTGERR